MHKPNNKWKLAATVALPVISGSIIGFIATRNARNEYQQLHQPKFAPPGWVFPVAWTTLYTTMGIAKYKFDLKPKSDKVEQRANLAYSTQLGLNFLWSFLFFRWNLRGTALLEAAMMWTAITVTTYYFYLQSKTAGNLMIPYLGWVTFALGLNYSIWNLNK